MDSMYGLAGAVYGIWMEVPSGAVDERGIPITDGWVFVTAEEKMFHTEYIQVATIQADQWNKLSKMNQWGRTFRVCEVGFDGQPVEIEDTG